MPLAKSRKNVSRKVAEGAKGKTKKRKEKRQTGKTRWWRKDDKDKNFKDL